MNKIINYQFDIRIRNQDLDKTACGWQGCPLEAWNVARARSKAECAAPLGSSSSSSVDARLPTEQQVNKREGWLCTVYCEDEGRRTLRKGTKVCI